jgi:cytidine deaminase
MSPVSLTPAARRRLLEAATAALGKAYAPYSAIRVGAAVLTSEGRIFSGANLENASYGLTLCAERVAVAVAAAALGGENLRLQAVAVVSDHPGPFPPCGACRQVLAEFGPKALILYRGEAGLEEVRLADLLPRNFLLRPG